MPVLTPSLHLRHPHRLIAPLPKRATSTPIYIDPHVFRRQLSPIPSMMEPSSSAPSKPERPNTGSDMVLDSDDEGREILDEARLMAQYMHDPDNLPPAAR